MKRLFIILSIISLSVLLQNCNNNEEELPQWIQDRIEADEALTNNPDYQYLEICEWRRYTYKKDYYYMFYNPILSSFPEIYDYDEKSIYDKGIDYNEFIENSCCMKVVWKA